MKPVRVAIIGCTGRMGRALLRLAAADPALAVGAAVTRGDDPLLGRDAGASAGIEPLGVLVSAELGEGCDAAVEFTDPAAAARWAEACAARGLPLVSGTTGLDATQRAALETAAKRIPLLTSPNMSVGVNLLLSLVRAAAARLGEEWDVELSETHHRHKLDAPSGTAKALLGEICAARGRSPEEAAVHGRSGAAPRKRGQIGVHALRMGEVVGEHEVHFAAGGEVLTLRHAALSRDAFAAGALRAAKWLVGRKPGLYGMSDVLG